MTTARPAALVLGSCRVFRPLRHLHHDGRIRITDIGGPAWFTHSVAEARQLVEVLAGERSVPDDLRSLVCENLWGDPSAPLGSPALDAVDVVVLEVSTTKSYTVGETQLNMHCLWNTTRDLDLPTRDVLRGAPVTWPESAGRVREVQVGRADPAEIRADVSAIAALTDAPVVLVDHIDTRPGGDPLEERRAITELLRSLESDGVAHFHATRPAIAALGEARALADSNHYLASAEPAVAEALERSVSDVLRWTAHRSLAGMEGPGRRPRKTRLSRTALDRDVPQDVVEDETRVSRPQSVVARNDREALPS